jgi:hypothetical protein
MIYINYENLIYINAKLFSKLIVLQLLIQYLKSDCGKPGYTDPYTVLHLFTSRPNGYNLNPEYTHVRYDDCQKGSMQFYNSLRTCKKGKWSGRPPKCGNLDIHKFSLFY